jgi:Fur family transcriptional regulator, ferric uptake regulator
MRRVEDEPKRPMVRMTRQRRVILEELRKTKSHPTADELHRMVRQRLPRVSLGTVYRNLEVLSEFGSIMRLDLAGRQRRFDGNATPHYHVRCVECGRVDDAMSPPQTQLEQSLTDTTGYRIIGHRLEFIGICPGCQKGPQGTVGGCPVGADSPQSNG